MMKQKDEGCLDFSKAGELGNTKAYYLSIFKDINH